MKKLEKFIEKKGKYPELQKVHKSDKFDIATDGVTVAIKFHTKDTSLTEHFEENKINSTIFSCNMFLEKKYNTVTVVKSQLLKSLKEDYNKLKEIHSKINEDLGMNEITIDLEINNNKLTYTMISQTDNPNSIKSKEIKIWNTENVRQTIVFNFEYLYNYIDFLIGKEIEINYKTETDAIYTKQKDRFMFLLPIWRH